MQKINMKPKDYKDAQTHYAKDDRGNSNGKFKEFIRDSRKETTLERIDRINKKPEEKPYYLYNVVKGELENINDPKFGKKDPPIMERRGKQTIALKNIGEKVLSEGGLKPEDVELKLNENGLHTNKDRTIAVRDSFVANAFNKSLGINKPTEATPEQFGALATRLERYRQTQGSSTDVEKFKNNFKEKPMSYREVSRKVFKDKRPFVEKKPTAEPVKIDLTPYKPFVPMDIPKRDPETLENERRFNQIVDESERAKFERNNSGLAGLMGGVKSGE